jgi:hypothetical protein
MRLDIKNGIRDMVLGQFREVSILVLTDLVREYLLIPQYVFPR